MMTTQIKRTLPRRWALLGALTAVMLVGGTALAVHDEPGGPMELEGDIADDATASGSDWGTFFGANGLEIKANVPAGTLDTTDVIRDFVPGASGPDITYHEPSNKDDQAIGPTGATWGCVSVANPTDKTDIVNAYGMAVQGDADASDGDTADDQLFYFGVERFDNSGDAFIGLWLFQDDVGCTSDGKFVGSKRTGDILILANFTGGGSDATIQLFRFTQGANPAVNPGTFSDLVTVTGTCNNTTEGAGLVNDICATLNDTTDVVTPWAMEDKIKPGPPNPDIAKTLEPDQFVEGGVNLTDVFLAANLGAPPCFGSFMAETRSSSSLDATLKDYALGDLQFCDARVKIDQSATNRVGTKHTFVVDVEQQLGAGYVAAPTGNVDVSLTGSDGIVAGDITIIAAESTCDDNQPSGDNLDASGQCTLTVNSLTETGKITANATVSVNVGGTALVRDTLSTTTAIGSGYSPESGPAVKTYVDATIDITGDDTNRVGDPHLFTVTIKKDSGDGLGFVAAASQTATVTLTPTFGATPVADDSPDTNSTCDDGTNASGQCVQKFSSATTGVVTGTASATVTFGALSFQITTANDAAVVGNEDATKVYVDATIDIQGDDANRVGDPHVFTVTVKKDLGDGDGFQNANGQIVTVTLTDTNGAAAVADDTPDTDSTCDDGTVNGQCTQKFSSAATGITTGTASTTVNFTNGLSFQITTANDAAVVGNEDATKKWVNARIGIAGTDKNSIEEDHTFTVTLEKDTSANGSYAAAGGEQVSVTLTDASGAVHVLDTTATTCDVPAESHDGTGTNGSGQCVVVFTSNTTGTVTASASASITVETVPITVNTGDATSTTAATVVKTFVDGSIRWLKHDGDAVLLGGATFEVCRTHRLDSSDGSYDAEDVDPNTAGNQPFCFTILDDDATDDDNTPGELQVNDLVLGKYTVKETIPPAGYHIKTPPGAGPFSFPDMKINPDVLDVQLSTIFVNIKAFRITVITCDDITDKLVDGTVTLDPGGVLDETKATISAADLVALGWRDANGVLLTEQAFCNMGGATFGDLPDDTYDMKVEVPDSSPLFPL